MSPRIDGAGLGLRRALLGPLQEQPSAPIDFFEIAPENWIGVGGKLGRSLRALTERHAFVCHGLSLSLGGQDPLDETLLARIRRLLDAHGIAIYSEHLSYCADEGHLYDLMPIPFTEEAVHHVAARIRQTQDVLGQRIAVENVSYYAAPGREMREIDFVTAVISCSMSTTSTSTASITATTPTRSSTRCPASASRTFTSPAITTKRPTSRSTRTARRSSIRSGACSNVLTRASA
jgi:uncharacterized protein (UPF0276 family)